MIRMIAAAIGGLTLWAGVANAAPLEAYGKLPSIEQAAISPSGARIAYIVTNGDERTVVVQTSEDRTTLLFAPAGKAKLRSIGWAGEGHVIITHSTTRMANEVISRRTES